MFWKIKKMLVSSTNIKKYRAKTNSCVGTVRFFIFSTCFLIESYLIFRWKSLPKNCTIKQN
ncbi:hypothetical protein DVW31_04705 [Enterococcus faecium]|nr:hypothetical protein DVV90_06345 [Enterococcus faecium]TKL37165.1 hypothetical protein DVW10_05855 [Enterococcus faecium]TKL41777.1 hypothetical protein DVV96_05825 [Enterococcus faecium]TKL44163.1 hypothetical protein DVV92_05885 [Enterococcus faecium]TKL45368.1 hypothetical protein DVW09_05840 [Enterococcus faecium]